MTAADYDALYEMDDMTHDRLVRAYLPLFRRVTEIVSQHRPTAVLEVGCGRGVLAEMLMAAGIPYGGGFDFNSIAVAKAQARNGWDCHFVADAINPRSYAWPNYDEIVCCEVLEHIERDLDAVRLWPPGTLCVASVPNFDDRTHVRYFRREAEIYERYGSLLDIDRIERIAKSPFTGQLPREYLKRLRWARGEPKKFLGMLGINRFEWHAGWFVFVGRRRGACSSI